jgi:hypothetical protein
MAITSPDLTEARWFPVDLHVPERRFGLLRLDDAVIARSSFLDTRLEAPLADAISVKAADVAVGRTDSRIGWLFHTSFCASTLLARALHLAPFEICLKEPLVLRRLSDAHHSHWPLDGLLEPTVGLLGRPWHPGGAVVIKPTHVALNIAVALLEATPGSRAILLTSTLDDFLISNLKKQPESQAKIPILVERALRATTFRTRLSAAALQPPDLVCAAGLQWAAQRELVQDVLEAAGPARIRAMDMTTLLGDTTAAVWECAQWFQLPAPREALEAHTRGIASRNAKAIEASYSTAQRAHEAAFVAQQHGDALAAAREWLEAEVLPAMRAPSARGSLES